MRIGTWNLAGRWGDAHLRLLESLACDVLLLTEVSERVEVPGMHRHLTRGVMAPRRRWAGVFSIGPLRPLPEPHGATALAEVTADDGDERVVLASSVLPWRSCGSAQPWVGTTSKERTAHAVDAIAQARPTVWGGDWNHALHGREYAGSMGGRAHLLAALDDLGLRAATSDSPHRIDGLASIDHVAVPSGWAAEATRHVAEHDGSRLSDHDAYVVAVEHR
ncbi:endonuclease/exonuclease/phosphatase family protein [Nocardioides sp. GY 10127]|uniref:endonuclease/exonuclease/phosphatase family protein n=1 Tax=Nocardioides sp. GY 10127 TaxID=2569762 RepID=UPI0010A94D66|nr:endonuclease/exonuclease/phosphatase family protein [Nocardioides sp. GY 10127]TIC85683.1 endonuclease/exonuclease/phosphatase family protein [Nocardioides sp. GY 10127]